MRFKTLYTSTLASTLLLASCSPDEVADLRTCTSPTMDGHTYEVVQIGEQCWFAENLKTTEFSDGTPIPEINPDHMADTKTAGRVVNPNLPDHYNTFYNGWTLLQPKGVCPDGWKVPSAIEFERLYEHARSTSVAEHQSVKGSEFCDPTDWNFTLTEIEHNRFGFNAQPTASIDLNPDLLSDLDPSPYTIFWTRFYRELDNPGGITKVPFVSINEDKFRSACASVTPEYGFCLRCILDE